MRRRRKERPVSKESSLSVTAVIARQCAPSLHPQEQRVIPCAMVNAWTVEARTLFRRFMRLTAATIVVAISLLLAIPFFIALALPFIEG
jgi:hypothetical protein